MRPSVLDGYRDLPIVVTGAASGIGAAVAGLLTDAGAEVVGVDRSPARHGVARSVQADLGDPDSLAAAVAQLPRRIGSLFLCAGLSDGAAAPRRVVEVNFLGLRELVEQLAPRIARGGAVVSTTSAAGRGYRENAADVLGLVRTTGFADGRRWCEQHHGYLDRRGGYRISKEALVLYTKLRCWELMERQGVRINTVGPGVTDTPMLADSAKAHGAARLDALLAPVGRRATAEEQAQILLYLNSGWASFVTGQVIWSDGGRISTEEVAALGAPVPVGTWP
ncbi:NAD(P)-dependent dehydrogenase, short-chain alcohol dehydrogenase family [Pseudonocardia thermophila]|uniref:NAD(P)-dependent dehydrogenase, short-chain alcohol dehydrogenase family n=1 Tax=Pseudonocardia thermophila TaxID=1848 RepID=A0A1M6XNX7_PSETH|nr:coniferyl-alcohol dehydrogenase [Pseudonocardia thermophila]SHL07671.1 NAD(P)-dependent dehydrogenase, short-chain alcohol dehydrogenase family [Pseudonocardia thermophila]